MNLLFTTIIILQAYIFYCQNYSGYTFAEAGEIQMIVYNKNPQTNNRNSSINKDIIFKQQFFNIPQIALGISFLDFGANYMDASFEISVENVLYNKAVVNFKKFEQTRVFGLNFTYLAVANQNEKENFITQQYKIPYSNELHIKPFKLPRGLGQKRLASCFLTGFNIRYSKSISKQIGLRVEKVDQNNYYVKVLTTEISTLSYIMVNCVEYYEEIASLKPYSMVADSQIIQSDSQKFITEKSPFFVDVKINKNFNGIVPDSLFGITNMINKYDSNIEGQRIIILKEDYYQQNNLQKFSIKTWDNSEIQFIEFGFFHYQMFDCQQNDQIYRFNDSYESKCVKECSQKQYFTKIKSVNNCKLCNPFCIECVQENECKECDQNYFINNNKQCEKCHQSCQECSLISTHCTSCRDLQFLTNNICYNEQPKSTICKQINNEKNSYSICNQCDSSQKYVFNNMCNQNKPNNTFCDSSNQCKQCGDQNCKECDSSLFTCTQCYPLQYLFKGKCSAQKPKNTICKNINYNS